MKNLFNPLYKYFRFLPTKSSSHCTRTILCPAHEFDFQRFERFGSHSNPRWFSSLRRYRFDQLEWKKKTYQAPIHPRSFIHSWLFSVYRYGRKEEKKSASADEIALPSRTDCLSNSVGGESLRIYTNYMLLDITKRCMLYSFAFTTVYELLYV